MSLRAVALLAVCGHDHVNHLPANVSRHRWRRLHISKSYVLALLIGRVLRLECGLQMLNRLVLSAHIGSLTDTFHLCLTHSEFSSNQSLFLTIDTEACRGLENQINYLEHVQAFITLRPSRRGDVTLYLVSPMNTTWVAFDCRTYHASYNGRSTYRLLFTWSNLLQYRVSTPVFEHAEFDCIKCERTQVGWESVRCT